MERYNIQTLSFLIGSFRDIVQSFGQNSKSVEFYKRQVYGLADIGQVKASEILFVEDLIGMRNTNAVKWDKAIEKIEQFIKAINETYDYTNDTSKIIAIERMEKSGEISSAVKDKVYEVYSIDTKNIIKKQNKDKGLNFGEIPSNKQMITNSKNNNINEFLNILINDNDNYKIKVCNSGAVCSSDPRFYSCELNKLLSKKYILNELAIGSDYQIGKEETAGDPCHPYKVIKEDRRLMAVARQIDWKEVYNNLEKYEK